MRRRLAGVCCVAVAACLLAPRARASFLGITWQGDVYRFSEGTNAPVFVGTSGFASVQAMAADSSGTIYAANHDSLFSVDPGTGAGTLVATLNLPTNTSSPRGLAFSDDDTLYGVAFRYGTIYGAGRLYTVDRSSGTVAEVNTNLINGTGHNSLQSLEYRDGSLYSWSLNDDRLIRIDPADGSGAPAFPSGATSDEPIQALALHPDGRLMAVRPGLYEIGTGDGALTPVNTNDLGDIRGVAFSAEPGKIADLVVGMTSTPAVLDTPRLLTYDLVVTNNGPSETFAVMLGHVLSSGAAVVQSTPPVSRRVGNTNVYDLGTLTNGEVRDVTVAVFVDFEERGPIFSGAGAIGYRGDPDTSNNASLVVTPLPDLDGDGRSDYADEDDDGDGMPDEWETLHFGARTNGSANSSTDGDASVDLHEYLAGTDPTNPGSFFAVEDIDIGSQGVVRVATSAERYYSLHQRAGLTTGEWYAVKGQGARVGTGGMMSLTGTSARSRGCYQVRARVDGPMRFVAVDHPGNAADVTGYGAVTGLFQIGRYEVTNEEYAEFLNAVASNDTFNLFHVLMGSDPRGGIRRRGSAGSYAYSPRSYMRDKPVNFISFYDALRFANWMHNGRPSGVQDGSTTEDGAYTFAGASAVGPRNAGALFWLPSEDEWYKAAYYDPDDPGADGGGSPDYWLYPSMSDSAPARGIVDFVGRIDNDTSPVANYDSAADWNNLDGNVTSVGSGGAGSLSPCGAADMGGNVYEWTEGEHIGSARVTRGGSWGVNEHFQRSTTRSPAGRSTQIHVIGFRLAGAAK